MPYIGQQPTSVAFLTDTFSGNGSTTAFTLSAAPANTSSVLVAVSGVLQDPSTYSVSGTTLTFSGAPPSGTSNISVRFLGIPASGVTTTAYRTVTEFTATAGQTTFSVPSYTPGFIDVYRNGVMLGSADYTASNGVSVVLASGATAGDLVEVISFSVSSVLNAVQSTGTTFSGNVLFAGGNGIWNTSGNVGVGTNSPSAKLDVLGNLGLNVAKFQQSGAFQPAYMTSTTNLSGVMSETNNQNGLLMNSASNFTSLWSGGAERMRINAAGQITTPSQPAFFANNPSSGTVNTYFAFNSVKVNRGSHYNSSNGRFTAPVAGVYSFIVSALGFGGSVSRLTFRVNGSDLYSDASAAQCRIDATASGSELPFGSKTAITSLNANDYIQVYYGNDSSSTMENLDWVCFGGQLIG